MSADPRLTDPSVTPLGEFSPKRASLFLSGEWFELLHHYGLPSGTCREDAQADVGKASQSGVHALLPLVREAGGFRSLSSYYSASYGFQDDVVPSPAGALSIAKWFRSKGTRRIELRPLLAEAPWISTMREALRACGYLSDTFHVSTNWYLPCAGLDWARYLATRPSRLANTLRRCRKRLESDAGFRIDIIDGASSDVEFGLGLQAYRQVYASSWKQEEPYPDFIFELCKLARNKGWLRLGTLHVGGEPAAAQLWFVKDGTASIYKLAYDSRFAKLGVGTVLTSALFRHVLDVDKVCEIDFLTGDDAYKSEWMTHSRELIGLVAWDGRNPATLAMALTHFAVKWLKKFVKS